MENRSNTLRAMVATVLGRLHPGHPLGVKPLDRWSEAEPNGRPMWNVGARGQAGAMIFLAHTAVLLVALVFIAMTFTPIFADA